MQEIITNLDKWAKEIAKETGFVLGEKIYQGEYYSPQDVRNVIYEGSYRAKPAVLKIYNDPRTTDEPLSLASFHKGDRSQILKAPKLYKYKMELNYCINS